MSKIRRDLSGLPAASNDAVGVAPDPDPWVGRQLGEAYLARHYQAEKAHAIEGTSFRMSMAGSCTRELAYYMAGTPESNPTDAASAWRMELGTLIHEQLQGVFLDAFPGAEVETKVHLPEIDGSGHIDIVVRQPFDDLLDLEDTQGIPVGEKVISIEVKTINGFGFKMAATRFNGPPEGPKTAHVIQAALGGKAVDADEVIVAYLSMENLSPDLAKYSDDPVFGKFTAQWTFTREQYMPIALAEEKRVRYVQAQLADGKPGEIPAYVLTDDYQAVQVMPPGSGQTVVTIDGKPMPGGKTWRCGYCRWKETCKADG